MSGAIRRPGWAGAAPALLLCGCAALAGCGRPGGAEVSGAVTRGGQPLAAGYVTFEPAPGTGGPGASARVEGGRFALGDRLPPGRYAVRVGPPALGSGEAAPGFDPWHGEAELRAGPNECAFDVPLGPKGAARKGP